MRRWRWRRRRFEPWTFRVVKRSWSLPPALKALFVPVGSEPTTHLAHLRPAPDGPTDGLKRHQVRRRHGVEVGVERRLPADQRRLSVDLIEVDHRSEDLTSGREEVVVDHDLRDVRGTDLRDPVGLRQVLRTSG